MTGTSEIHRGNDVVGIATVEKQGLYYRFSCQCRIHGQGMRRILVSGGKTRTDLGICVPIDDGFGLEKKIPCKQFGDGEPEFQLLPKYPDVKGQFVPVYPDEPFAYMSRLKVAYLSVQDGQTGIVIAE